MFAEYHIVARHNGVLLNRETEEFEVLPVCGVEVLIQADVFSQLKISALKFGFSLVDNRLYLMQQMEEHLEIWEDTIRFKFDARSVFNTKDLALYAMWCTCIGQRPDHDKLMVNRGGKDEVVFPVASEPLVKGEQVLPNRLMDIIRSIPKNRMTDLKQRFWILLNDTYLNKLKTYVLYWHKTHGIETNLPDWCNRLLDSDTEDMKAKVDALTF